MASDSLNQIGRFVKKTRQNSDYALKRYHANLPTVENVRDVFDPDIPFEMAFKTRRKEDKVSLNLTFREPPPLRGCKSECISNACESFTLTGTSHYITVAQPYVATTVSIFVDGDILPASQFNEDNPEGGGIYIQTPSGEHVVVVCYIYGDCSEEDDVGNCDFRDDFERSLTDSWGGTWIIGSTPPNGAWGVAGFGGLTGGFGWNKDDGRTFPIPYAPLRAHQIIGDMTEGFTLTALWRIDHIPDGSNGDISFGLGFAATDFTPPDTRVKSSAFLTISSHASFGAFGVGEDLTGNGVVDAGTTVAKTDWEANVTYRLKWEHSSGQSKLKFWKASEAEPDWMATYTGPFGTGNVQYLTYTSDKNATVAGDAHATQMNLYDIRVVCEGAGDACIDALNSEEFIRSEASGWGISEFAGNAPWDGGTSVNGSEGVLQQGGGQAIVSYPVLTYPIELKTKFRFEGVGSPEKFLKIGFFPDTDTSAEGWFVDIQNVGSNLDTFLGTVFEGLRYGGSLPVLSNVVPSDTINLKLRIFGPVSTGIPFPAFRRDLHAKIWKDGQGEPAEYTDVNVPTVSDPAIYIACRPLSSNPSITWYIDYIQITECNSTCSSTIITLDNFNRIEVSDFGTASSGGTWTVDTTQGNVTESVDGTKGIFVAEAAGPGDPQYFRRLRLDIDGNHISGKDWFELRALVSSTDNVGTGSADGISVRIGNGTDFVAIFTNTSGVNDIHYREEGNTHAVYSYPFTAGDPFWMALRVDFLAGTIIGKAWSEIDLEPSEWGSAAIADSLTNSNVNQVYVTVTGRAANTFTVDNISITVEDC